jgi:hypothetical protein
MNRYTPTQPNLPSRLRRVLPFARRGVIPRGRRPAYPYIPEPDEDLPESDLADNERRRAMERERWRREGRG